MFRLPTTLLALIAFLILSGDLYAQTHKWELSKHENGIKIFTRKVDGSTFKEFRAVTVMDAEVNCFVSVLQDISHYTDWMDGAMMARLIERKNETRQVYYVATDTPWPATDRDGVYAMKFEYLPAERSVLAYVNVEKGIIPENNAMVRVQKADGYWKFRDLGDGKTEVTFQIHPNPGGSVPAWLANSGVTSNPFNTLKGLRTQVAKSQYQDQEFEFLTAGK